MIMSFLTNCLVDGVGEEGKGGEAALSQTLMQIFGGSGGCLHSLSHIRL